MVEALGYVAAFFTVTMTVPQLLKTIKTKSAGDVSIFMFVFMIIGTTLWAIYGYLIGSTSIVISNTMAASMVAINLFYKVRYK